MTSISPVHRWSAWMALLAWLAGTPPSLASSGPLEATQTYVSIESGVAWSGYNDVRIPRDSGTRFSLTEDLESDPTAFFRVRLGIGLGDRHSLSLLAAPLRISAEGRLDRAVAYQGVEFNRDAPLSALYRFDSYRVTYRYTLYRSMRLQADVGLTAKIRDAEITLSSPEQHATKTDTGFVPLLSFALYWRVGPGLQLILDGDALASPGGQGRAEDLFVGLQTDLAAGMALRGGYRLLEGGADVPAVYNFTLVHYLSLGLTFSLPR
jgi:hypothetical protein